MKRLVLVCMLFFVALISSNAMSATAGSFQWPFNVNQAWPLGVPENCTSTGYFSINNGVTVPNSQYYMELNTELPAPKYHMGEDWNGRCNGNTDKGGELRALADGYVVYVDNVGTGPKGKRVKIRYDLPSGISVYDEKMHCDTVLVTQGSSVIPGQKVATIGKTGTLYAHLHWEMHKENLPLTNPSYQQPLTVANALRLTAPSLFIDDRIGGVTIPMTNGVWTTFTVQNYTPSSIAYIQNSANGRFSIKRAVDAGIIEIYGIFWQETDGNWYYSSDVTKVFLVPNVKYAIIAKAN